MTRKIIALIAGALALQACATADRLSYVGEAPPMTPMQDPSGLVGPQPLQMPMPPQYAQQQPQAQPNPGYPQQGYPQQGQSQAQHPAYAQPQQVNAAPNSLWRSDSRTFFGDPRAQSVGDILTVQIDITDSAQVRNTTARSRTSDEDLDLSGMLGYDLTDFFNDSIDPSAAVDLGSTSSMQGAGSVNRQESISLTVAVIVTQVLPNGNMVIAGRQEVRVNNEVRELLITGIARPEDIASDNTIQHSQIAEARISYGGRGHLSDMQRPRLGSEIYDILMPF